MKRGLVSLVVVCGVVGCSSSVPSGPTHENTGAGAVIHRDSTMPLTSDEVEYQKAEVLRIQREKAVKQQRELEDLRRQDYQNERLRKFERE